MITVSVEFHIYNNQGDDIRIHQNRYLLCLNF
jgi:hypothetical protein